MSPRSKPRRNQVTRCSEVPCVKLSGRTRPVASAGCVVANRRRGAEAVVDVAGLEPTWPCEEVPGRWWSAPRRRRSSRPGARAARSARSCARATRLRLTHLPLDSEDFLHVVAHLVSDDVGLRELPRGAEARGQLVEESRDRDRPSRRSGNRTVRSARPRRRSPRCRRHRGTGARGSADTGSRASAATSPGRPRCTGVDEIDALFLGQGVVATGPPPVVPTDAEGDPDRRRRRAT